MNKSSASLKIFLQIFLPALLIIVIDQVTKYHAVHFSGKLINYNTGIMTGIFASTNSFVQNFIIFSFFFLITSFFILIQFLYFDTFRFLSVLSTTLLASYSSNLIDKLRTGAVVDYIPVKIDTASTLMLNVADLVQLLSVSFILAYALINFKSIFLTSSKRKTLLVDNTFQISNALFTSLFSMLAGISIAVLSYSTIKPFLHISIGSYWVAIGFFLICFSVTVFISNIIFLHRAAGPVYAIKRYLSELESGKVSSLKFRKNDFFKYLEGPLNKLSDQYKNFK